MNNGTLILNHIKHNIKLFPTIFLYFSILTIMITLTTLLIGFFKEKIIHNYLSTFKYSKIINKMARIMISSKNSSKVVTYFDFFVGSWLLVLWGDSLFFFFNASTLKLSGDTNFLLCLLIFMSIFVYPILICNTIKSKINIPIPEK